MAPPEAATELPTENSFIFATDVAACSPLGCDDYFFRDLPPDTLT